MTDNNNATDLTIMSVVYKTVTVTMTVTVNDEGETNNGTVLTIMSDVIRQ